MNGKSISSNLSRLLFALVIVTGLAVTTSDTHAQILEVDTIVVPGITSNIEGNYANGYPFHLSWANKQSMRYQQVYASTEFPDSQGAYLITEIAFRPDAGWFGQPFTATIPDIQFNFSTTLKEPDHLSTVFAYNVGANDKVVYSGPLTLSSQDLGPSEGPMDFDIVIPLQEPFVYDPNTGNLLLDIRSYSSAWTTGFDAQDEYGDGVSRVFSSEYDGVVQTSGWWHTGGLITKFSLLPGNNIIPIADPGGPYIAQLGTPIQFDGGGSSDPMGEPLTYFWDYGDGTIGDGANPKKEFRLPGMYETCLTVNNRIIDSPEVCTHAIIYAPAGGFVTGGGWIWSGVGNYIPEPNVSGWASFGFVAKYHKGAEVPDGQAEMVYHDTGMNFHSTEYEWLVVTGSDTAKFKGTGTINGDGDYKFMIWAGDGEPDTFRIKIWEEINGQELVVYDNSLANSSYENGQPIGRGEIIIHSPKKKAVEILDQSQTEINYGFWFDDEVPRWQEFIPSGDNISAVEVYIKKNGNPGNVVAEIRSTNNEILAQETVFGDSITSSGWVRFEFPNPVDLLPGDTYRLYIYADQDTLSVENVYFWRGDPDSIYCPGCDNDVKGSWPGYAYAFKTYMMTD